MPTTDHFYTTNPAERRQALRIGYRDETASSARMYVFDRPVLHAGVRTVPLHRLYSTTAHDHFYPRTPTAPGYTDETRRDSIWVFPDDGPPGAVRLYELWSPTAADHFYTTDRSEAKRAVRQREYRMLPGSTHVLHTPEMAEGITAVQLHRLYRT